MMLVSQAEYARQRGVSRQYVGQMVAKGIIGLSNRKVDTAQADAALAALREPARPERRPKPEVLVPTFEALPASAPPSPAGERRASSSVWLQVMAYLNQFRCRPASQPVSRLGVDRPAPEPFFDGAFGA